MRTSHAIFLPYIYSSPLRLRNPPMRPRLALLLPALLCIAVIIPACSSPDPVSPTPDPPITLQKIAEVEEDGMRIELYGEQAPVIGANTLHLVLTDIASGSRLRAGTVTVRPAMDMPGAPHTAPHEQPTGVDTSGAWRSMVVFTMTGAWKLDVTSTNGTRTVAATLSFSVGASRRARAVIASNGEIYIVTFVEPRTGDVGLNPCEILLHHQATLTDYPPVTDATIDLEPTMPSMGHGSLGNVDPVHTARGHYVGKVNFLMLGDWRLDFAISIPDPNSETTPITLATSFDITL